jgi:hypothetical protein
MNVLHFQSGLIASAVFTEFPVILLVDVILSEGEESQDRLLERSSAAIIRDVSLRSI